VRKQTSLNQFIDASGLTNIHTVKFAIDGKRLCKLYEVQPGPIMKPLLDELFSFQILHPGASVEDAEVYMVAKKGEFLAKHVDNK